MSCIIHSFTSLSHFPKRQFSELLTTAVRRLQKNLADVMSSKILKTQMSTNTLFYVKNK